MQCVRTVGRSRARELTVPGIRTSAATGTTYAETAGGGYRQSTSAVGGWVMQSSTGEVVWVASDPLGDLFDENSFDPTCSADAPASRSLLRLRRRARSRPAHDARAAVAHDSKRHLVANAHVLTRGGR